jgi:hypothetical protein
LISFGTGRATIPLFFDDAKDMGIVGWGMQVANLLIDGPSDITNRAMESLSMTFGERLKYIQLQVELQRENAEMDNTDPRNMAALTQRAEFLAGTEKFHGVVDLLRSIPNVTVRNSLRQHLRQPSSM